MNDRLTRPKTPAKPGSWTRHGLPTTGGRLIYAVSDVHGYLDPLNQVMAKISRDARGNAGEDRPVLVFVGDYIDRGAASKGAIDCLLQLAGNRDFELRALKGNHEQALLQFVADAKFGPAWCDHGGATTLASYGVAAPRMRSDMAAWSRAREQFLAVLPAEHLRFFNGLELSATYGEYFFVHAGVRPGLPLAAQTEEDLLWIRDPFLNADEPFEKIIVHGHSPESVGHMGEHRIGIGIDTGVYATGVLTAVRLENSERRFIQSGPGEHRRRPLRVAVEQADRESRFTAKAERFKRVWATPAEA